MGTVTLMLSLAVLLVSGVKCEFYPFMGTRTAYQLVHGFAGRPEVSCKPIQLYTVVRHGARYPDRKIFQNLLNTTKYRERIIANHKSGRGHLDIVTLNKLHEWKLDPSVNMSVTGNLSVQGKVDIFNYAKRIQTAFPELLKKNLNDVTSNDYVFQATKFERAKLSLQAFGDGLFGKFKINQSSVVNETLLHFYGHCPAWYSTYHEGNIEWEKFKVGPEAQSLVRNISDRLGFSPRLNYATVKSIFEICRYELAWFPERQSPWCDLFTTDDIKFFEYAEDLDYYYYCGPGRPMSKLIGCGILKDMLQRFEKLETADYHDQPKGVFYFGHSTTLHTVFAAMDIGKETKPINSTNYAKSADRNYRTTFLGPFASNLMAVFYKCKGYASPNKVMFYVAEKLITFPGCKNGLCDWEMIKKKYTPRVGSDVCNQDLCYKKYRSNEELRRTFEKSEPNEENFFSFVN